MWLPSRGFTPMRDQRRPHARDAAAMAEAILELIAQAPTLRQSYALRGLAAFFADVGGLLRYAVEQGVTLRWGHATPARPNAVTEFYFDVSKGKQSLGYISKGWDDPGARVGDLLRISATHTVRVKRQIKALVDSCASQGVSLQLHAGSQGAVELHVWTPVYGQPVSPAALHEAVKALQRCKQRIRRICPFA